MGDLQERYSSIRAEIGNLGVPWDFPPHLVWRLAVAMGDEELQYVDSDLAQTAPRTYTGTVVLFTDTRVIRTVMTDGPAEPRQHEAPTYTVQLTTWRRAALRMLELAPDKQSWRNSDSGWTGLNIQDGYPVDFAVTLHYDAAGTITLPLLAQYRQGERTRRLFDCLPDLLRDLSNGAVISP